MRMSVHTWPGSCAGRTFVKCAESPVFTCWPDTNWVCVTYTVIIEVLRKEILT